MFAESRIANVRGRINKLIISIEIMKGHKMRGV